MTVNPPPKDLVVLTADKQAQAALQGIFTRHHSLGIRQVAPDYRLHPGKDPGILHTAHDFLRPFSKAYGHALIVMDREGSGQEEQLTRTEMEERIETALKNSGWSDRVLVGIFALSRAVAGLFWLFAFGDSVDPVSIVIGEYPLPGPHSDATFSPDGKTCYVAARGSNGVAAVDTATKKITARIPAGKEPKRLLVVGVAEK